MKVICIGGGASSFYFASQLVAMEAQVEVLILEQGKDILNKVRISGGGRCNVTHHCYEPKELINYYPRGHKELLGPFYSYNPTQTISYFERHGVPLKVEEDGRIFPKSDSSESIISVLSACTSSKQVKCWTKCKVMNFQPLESGVGYVVELADGQSLTCDYLFIGAGSSKLIWDRLASLGHHIIDPIPSLFTFKVNDRALTDLAGISIPQVRLNIPSLSLESEGPLLITHKGLSGPAVLKLSAWGARPLFKVNYTFDLLIDFLPSVSESDIQNWKTDHGPKALLNHHVTQLPKRLHRYLLSPLGFQEKKWAELSKKEVSQVHDQLKRTPIHVSGQNRFKEEFVTAGGVDLKEINFKNFSSRILPNCYICGETLNIDGVTGGFNFQACWTGAYLAAQHLSEISSNHP